MDAGSPAGGCRRNSGREEYPCNNIRQYVRHGWAGNDQSVSDLPNATEPVGFNYTNDPVRKLNEGEFDIRLDHNFSSKDSIFARFSYDQAASFVPGGSPGLAEQNAFASTQDITTTDEMWPCLKLICSLRSQINQLNVGFNRIFNHIVSFGNGSCIAAQSAFRGRILEAKCNRITGYPTSLNQSNKDCIGCGMSSTQMSGYFSLGDRGFAPFQGGTNVYSVSETLRHDSRQTQHPGRISDSVPTR